MELHPEPDPELTQNPEPINNSFLDVAFSSHRLDIGELITLHWGDTSERSQKVCDLKVLWLNSYSLLTNPIKYLYLSDMYVL
jgi:hypothetical protein